MPVRNLCQNTTLNPFDSYMLNKVRRLKDVASTGGRCG